MRIFPGESSTNPKHQIFAEKARSERLKNVARFFVAVAFVEFVHARSHFETHEYATVTETEPYLACSADF